MKFKFEIGDLFKIPNILCYIRILMVPLFLYLYITAESQTGYYLAAGVVILSGLTDFLDGQIARRFDMVTDLGRIIDPLADKLMQLAMLVALTFRVKYMYLVVIYLIVKELVMLLTGAIVLKTIGSRLNGAKWYGKVCTATLYIVMMILVLLPGLNSAIQNALILICVIVLTMAFVLYMKLYVVMILDSKNDKCDKILY